ncbi:hypothetical protein HDU87_001067 [Geranomyces variabilis]|uniref:Uncharacterized protein n=1 Tax=Geranomyces variabilis TaxID=109894 RepID=A0AAD5XU16_9FUNG|nr:hypothetical protein HDU87_001067 [Geranomyces variabilis]
MADVREAMPSSAERFSAKRTTPDLSRSHSSSADAGERKRKRLEGLGVVTASPVRQARPDRENQSGPVRATSLQRLPSEGAEVERQQSQDRSSGMRVDGTGSNGRSGAGSPVSSPSTAAPAAESLTQGIRAALFASSNPVKGNATRGATPRVSISLVAPKSKPAAAKFQLNARSLGFGNAVGKASDIKTEPPESEHPAEPPQRLPGALLEEHPHTVSAETAAVRNTSVPSEPAAKTASNREKGLKMFPSDRLPPCMLQPRALADRHQLHARRFTTKLTARAVISGHGRDLLKPGGRDRDQDLERGSTKVGQKRAVAYAGHYLARDIPVALEVRHQSAMSATGLILIQAEGPATGQILGGAEAEVEGLGVAGAAAQIVPQIMRGTETAQEIVRGGVELVAGAEVQIEAEASAGEVLIQTSIAMHAASPISAETGRERATKNRNKPETKGNARKTTEAEAATPRVNAAISIPLLATEEVPPAPVVIIKERAVARPVREGWKPCPPRDPEKPNRGKFRLRGLKTDGTTGPRPGVEIIRATARGATAREEGSDPTATTSNTTAEKSETDTDATTASVPGTPRAAEASKSEPKSDDSPSDSTPSPPKKSLLVQSLTLPPDAEIWAFRGDMLDTEDVKELDVINAATLEAVEGGIDAALGLGDADFVSRNRADPAAFSSYLDSGHLPHQISLCLAGAKGGRAYLTGTLAALDARSNLYVIEAEETSLTIEIQQPKADPFVADLRMDDLELDADPFALIDDFYDSKATPPPMPAPVEKKVVVVSKRPIKGVLIKGDRIAAGKLGA